MALLFSYVKLNWFFAFSLWRGHQNQLQGLSVRYGSANDEKEVDCYQRYSCEHISESVREKFLKQMPFSSI